MKSFKSLAATALFSAVDAASDTIKYAYLSNGDDWKYISDSQCGESNQSPIDLRTMDHSNPFPVYDGSEFKGRYRNFVATDVVNKGKVIQANLPASEADENCFRSEWATE